jgi:hypothetical protein
MAQERRRHAPGRDLEGFEEVGVHEKEDADGEDKSPNEAAEGKSGVEATR